MRYEKAEVLVRLALDLQGSLGGLSLDEIRERCAPDPAMPLSRRTAERLRDAIERLFPQLEQTNPGEFPKRWRLPSATANSLTEVDADELAALATAAAVLRRENLADQAAKVDSAATKLRATLKRQTIARIEPDLEPLLAADGLVCRPGPKPRIDTRMIAALRRAIIGQNIVLLHYRYRGSGRRGYDSVHPYGFLYGNRHYLVAWSENERTRNFRSFALSNIERVEIREEIFDRDPDFSLAAYAARSFGVFQEEPFEVVWKFTPKAAPDAREFMFHPTQVMEDLPDGSLIVGFRAGGALEMAWHLVTWGNEVEVVKPERLRDLMRHPVSVSPHAVASAATDDGIAPLRSRADPP